MDLTEAALARFKHRLDREIATLKQEERYYVPSMLASAQGPRIDIDGRSYINLASNNYLGFADDPQVVAAARDALDHYGFGLGGGRLIYGMELHQQLERRLAAFKRREAAIVFQTGYDTNLSALSTLVGEGDVLISDAANHASIVDGSRLSRAERRIYPHGDLDALESHLREVQGDRTIVIVTDGVFSMDGDIAPLPDIVTLAERYGALVYADDAHGDGVLGATGSGIVEHFGLHGRVAFEMGTLSKALGGMGGFLASDAAIVEYLFQRSRPFMFSTGHLPPAIAAGLLAALNLLSAQPERVRTLWDNASYLRAGLQRLGFDTGASETPIIPVIAGGSARAMALSRGLRTAGVYVQAFAYPVVPEGKARVRVILSAGHRRADLDEALSVFETVGRSIGLL